MYIGNNCCMSSLQNGPGYSFMISTSGVFLLVSLLQSGNVSIILALILSLSGDFFFSSSLIVALCISMGLSSSLSGKGGIQFTAPHLKDLLTVFMTLLSVYFLLFRRTSGHVQSWPKLKERQRSYRYILHSLPVPPFYVGYVNFNSQKMQLKSMKISSTLNGGTAREEIVIYSTNV